MPPQDDHDAVESLSWNTVYVSNLGFIMDFYMLLIKGIGMFPICYHGPLGWPSWTGGWAQTEVWMDTDFSFLLSLAVKTNSECYELMLSAFVCLGVAWILLAVCCVQYTVCL